MTEKTRSSSILEVLIRSLLATAGTSGGAASGQKGANKTNTSSNAEESGDGKGADSGGKGENGGGKGSTDEVKQWVQVGDMS